MTPLEDQIRDLYRQVTDAEQPPPKVSIAEALRRGRLVRWWRRFSAAAVPVVAVAAVAGIALAATPPAHVHRAAPAKPPIPNPVPQPGLFNPLTVNMSFGWLPPREAALTGATGDVNGSLIVYQERNLNLNSSASRDANTRWRLSDYARGICTFDSPHHRLLCNGQSSLSGAAPAINGDRAFWESSYGPLHPALVWEFAPGYWAELVGVGLQQSDQTLLRIARSVAFGGEARQQVKFAVQLTGVPSGWRIGATSVTRSSGNWLAEHSTVETGKRLLWADASWPPDGLPAVTTHVGGGSCSQFGYMDHGNPRVINGYHVETLTVRPGRGITPFFQLCAPRANGLLVYELLSGAHAPVSVTALFQHMRLLGPKPSDWTAFPFG